MHLLSKIRLYCLKKYFESPRKKNTGKNPTYYNYKYIVYMILISKHGVYVIVQTCIIAPNKHNNKQTKINK
jgi:hypothetical protein